MQNLEGKVALVTGGASGIGLAMVNSFAASGMRVVMADIEADALATAHDGFGDSNADVQPMLLDVTDPGRFEAVVDEVERDIGEVEVLCNNAGVGVAHARDIVVGVKVPPAVRVKQPDAFPSDELNRLVVKERRTMTKDLFVASE